MDPISPVGDMPSDRQEPIIICTHPPLECPDGLAVADVKHNQLRERFDALLPRLIFT